MKIGDYVRTEYGIAKIEEIKPDDKHKTIWYTVDKAQYHCFLVKAQDIIKSSPNIIGVIEEGDYVNGHVVNTVDSKKVWCGDEEGIIDIYEDCIFHIVTHEQFEKIGYSLE